MCTIAFAWRTLADAPLVVAANRDEALDRESLPPRVLGTEPTIVAPQDAEAGGTWIGVTERGLFVAITNRWTKDGPPDLPAGRSRGLLVRDALRSADADGAVALVREQVDEHSYAGFNLLVADATRATYLEWDGDLRVEDLEPGVHVVVNPGLNEADDRALRLRDELAGETADGDAAAADGATATTAGATTTADGDVTTADAWLDAAAARLRDHDYGVCVHRDGFGTRSSSLLSMDADGRVAYDFADGPPCETDYVPVDLPVPFLDRRG